jgi:AraC-like DNA-binding protein
MSTFDQEPTFFSRQVLDARRFHLDLRPNRRLPLVVVSGGWERCAADYEIQRSNFPYLAIELVAAGELTLDMGGRSYDLAAGSIFTYGPGIPHRLRSAGRPSLHKYFVDFMGHRAVSLLRRIGLPPGTVQQVPNPIALRELLDAMISAGLRHTNGTPAICTAILEAFALTVGDSAVEHVPEELGSLATYRRCRALLEARASELHTLEEAARMCHVAPSYLCRLFARYDRETPYQMMQRQRLQRAAALLLEPGAMVKNVAAELGFSDPFHFSHAFKRHFGVPPVQIMRRTS